MNDLEDRARALLLTIEGEWDQAESAWLACRFRASGPAPDVLPVLWSDDGCVDPYLHRYATELVEAAGSGLGLAAATGGRLCRAVAVVGGAFHRWHARE